MYRPATDYSQFRPGGLLPAPPAPPAAAGMMNMGPPFATPPMPGRPFMMAQFSGGLPGYPLPPATLPPPLSGQSQPFVPPLPPSPPAEVPPPPSVPPPSPPPPPLEESTAIESLPPEPPKPSDSEMLKNIEVLAAFVVKNGPQFESMERAKQAGDPNFAFLFESDVGPEAVIGHEYYKWKKQSLQLQLRLEAENKVNKQLDQGKFPGRVQQASRTQGQQVLSDDVPGSPTMSDMDMEDDFEVPSPKRVSVEQLANAKAGTTVKAEQLNFTSATTSMGGKEGYSRVDKISDAPPKQDPAAGGFVKRSFVEEKREDEDQAHPLSINESIQGEQRHVRTGLILMDYSFSDTSDASGDYEQTESVDKAGNGRSDCERSMVEQDKHREQESTNLDEEDNVLSIKAISQDAVGQVNKVLPLKVSSHDADDFVSSSPAADLPVKKGTPLPEDPPVTKISRQGSPRGTQRRRSLEEIQNFDSSSKLNINDHFQAGGRGRRAEYIIPSSEKSFSDASDSSKGWERPASTDRTDDRGLENDSFGVDVHEDREGATVDEFGRLVREGTSESESYEGQHLPSRRSYSRSRSRSPENSRRRRQTRNRSRSRSPWRRMTHSRTPPRDSRQRGTGRGEQDWRGDGDFQERGKRGGRGSKPNVCFNYVRGRCFRGNSCRFLHQDRKVTLQEQDAWMQGVEEETPGAEVKIKQVQTCRDVYAADKLEVEAVQNSDIAKQNEEGDEIEERVFDREITALENADICTQEDAEEEPQHGGELEVVEKPERSTEVDADVKLEFHSDLERTEELKESTKMASIEQFEAVTKSIVSVEGTQKPGQSYTSADQLYPPGDLGFGLQQPISLHHPLPSGNLPPYGQSSSLSQPVNITNTNTGNSVPTGSSNLLQPFPMGNQFLAQQSTVISRNPGPSQAYPVGNLGVSQQAFLPGASIREVLPLSQNHVPPSQPGYGASFSTKPNFVQNPILTHHAVFAPQSQPFSFPSNQPLSFPSNPPMLQQQSIPNTLTSGQHGFGSNLSLPPPQTLFPRPFIGDASKQFTFPSLVNDGLQNAYSRPLVTQSAQSIQNAVLWVLPGSFDSLTPLVSALPPQVSSLPPLVSAVSALPTPVSALPPPVSALSPTTRQSSAYSYSLTTIPPLSNLIKLPGMTNLSDQYDPLSDSLDPGRKPDTFEANINEAADPGVGIVENVSPPDDNRNWSPGQPAQGAASGQDLAQSKIKKNSRGLKLLRSAVAEYVKEVLKPTWREGHMSKDAFKTIAKKTVDKVSGTIPSHHIPKSQEKVDQFMASSRSKIAKLVQGYVDKYLKA